MASPCFRPATSHPAHDVGPDAAHCLLAVLVGRLRLEDVEALVVLLEDVDELGGGRDLVAGADRLAPNELLAPVNHGRDVDTHLRIEDAGGDRRRAVDDAEHRRRDDVAKAGGLRCLEIVMYGGGRAERVPRLAEPAPAPP